MDRYYKHSGKFSPLGVVLGLLAGTVVSVPVAFAYNYGIFSIPEARLRVLCTIAYGALVGAASGVAMCWGKVRSKAVAGLISFGASLFALYLSWAVWILHLLYPSFWVFNPLRAALHPRMMWKVVLGCEFEGHVEFQQWPADKRLLALGGLGERGGFTAGIRGPGRGGARQAPCVLRTVRAMVFAEPEALLCASSLGGPVQSPVGSRRPGIAPNAGPR